jgi:hypothetical protein
VELLLLLLLRGRLGKRIGEVRRPQHGVTNQGSKPTTSFIPSFSTMESAAALLVVVPSETFSSCSVVYLFHSILANIFDYLMREVHEGVDHSECMVISCQNE